MRVSDGFPQTAPDSAPGLLSTSKRSAWSRTVFVRKAQGAVDLTQTAAEVRRDAQPSALAPQSARC